MKALAEGRVFLHAGDCIESMNSMPENSVDTVFTDPPYHLYDPKGSDKIGFAGKMWDGGDIAFRQETWAAAMRVLKPGGNMLVFNASRQWHRISCAIEDAGMEIMDHCLWMYGSGQPHGFDVSRGVDKAMGAERVKIEVPLAEGGVKLVDSKEAVSEEGRRASGWNTRLKPCFEPIVWAQKPISEKNVTQNWLRWGTGAINVGECGVPLGEGSDPNAPPRYPGNLVCTDDEEVRGFFEQYGTSKSQAGDSQVVGKLKRGVVGNGAKYAIPFVGKGDSGTPQRYFKSFPCVDEDDAIHGWRAHYHRKALPQDRDGSKHPTVKPPTMLEYFLRLSTRPGGIVLDPFAGSGTMGVACLTLGLHAVLCEREQEYIDDISRRFGGQQEIEDGLSALHVGGGCEFADDPWGCGTTGC